MRLPLKREAQYREMQIQLVDPKHGLAHKVQGMSQQAPAQSSRQICWVQPRGLAGSQERTRESLQLISLQGQIDSENFYRAHCTAKANETCS